MEKFYVILQPDVNRIINTIGVILKAQHNSLHKRYKKEHEQNDSRWEQK